MATVLRQTGAIMSRFRVRQQYRIHVKHLLGWAAVLCGWALLTSEHFGSISCRSAPDEYPCASFAIRADQKAQTAHLHGGQFAARYTAVDHAEFEHPTSSAYGRSWGRPDDGLMPP